MLVRSILMVPLASAVCSVGLSAGDASGQVPVRIDGPGEFVFEVEQVELSAVGGDFSAMARRERDRLEPVTAAELERYNARLGLTVEQQVFASELFTEYRDRLLAINAEEEAGWMALAEQENEWRDLDAALGSDQMLEHFAAVQLVREEATAKREAITEEFFADYRLVLTAEQLEEWPSIERMRRRDRELAPGTFPGEDIDLIALCAEMELDFDPERVSEGGEGMLAEVFGRYELEIDRLLVARLAIEAKHPMAASAREGRFAVEIDMAAMEKWQGEQREAASRLQKAQQKYVRQVGELLSAASRAALEARVLALSYPRVHRASIVDSQLEAIGGLADLDDEQRAELERLSEEYRRERARLDREWMAAIDAELADGGGAMAMPGMQIFVGMPGQESATGKAMRARRALDRSWVERVRGVLRPEQAESVPAPPSPGGAIIRSVTTIDPVTGEESETITVELENPGEGN
jgi:hypothetical protein